LGKKFDQKSPRITTQELSLIRKMNTESGSVNVEEANQIQKLANPKLEYERSLIFFQSPDWEQQVSALNVLRSVI